MHMASRHWPARAAPFRRVIIGISARTIGRVLPVCCAGFGAGGASADVSEQDFFTEMPEVLSVSRLAQPLDEAPGAVTVLDRDMIRRSGARTVQELLRLVPGFITSHFEGAARPIAHYHAEYNGIVRRLQVFVDGRSVYSSLLVGSANQGMLAVVLEDIERIEVLRGSNSAAYGANAFLGVVNIVTRHAADTRGGLVALNVGEAGVKDGTARVGWGGERAQFRLTAASRADRGFDNLADNNRLGQVHFRADLQPTGVDELTVTAGHAESRWNAGNAPATWHDESWRNGYARLQWTRGLNATDQVKVSGTIDEERYGNFYPMLRADGMARRAELEAEHGLALGGDWRLVWGGQYRHEQVESRDLFPDRLRERLDLWRVFGNVEWKPHPDWVVNAGGLFERHSITGGNASPRLVVNYHLLPGHTLRAGKTSADKQPTLFELRADWRSGATPVVLALGNARPERVYATELGYLGEFRRLGLSVDVRIFEEKVRDLLAYQKPCPTCANDLVNKDPSVQRGWETQLRWQPVAGTQLLFNHTELRLIPDASSTSPQDAGLAPRHFSTLAWFQRLPDDYELTVIHTEMAKYFYVRASDIIPAYRQTDLRVGRRFQIGGTRAEAALTVRAVAGSHLDYVQRSYPPMVVGSRAFATLRLEY